MTGSASWRSDVVWWLAAATVTTFAFWVGVSPIVGLVVGAGMFGLVAVLHVGRRRSDTIRAISGSGDERDQQIYVRAMAAAGTVLGFAVTGWWLFTVASGRSDQTLFVLCILFAGSFFASAAILASRR